MTRIKRFLLALALPPFLASHSNAQVSTTGNLIQNDANQWTSGCYTLQSEGFWGGTSGGPCPGIWDNNEKYSGQEIVFSYGQQTLSQTHSLASALPNSGTGLQVNGYNWHWHVKNSNINDTQPGGYDTTAYVTVDLLNSSGSVLESDKYDYGYRIADWINPSGTRTYTNPYSTTQADSIRLSVTGKDDGFWAGYYGPEFSHFTLSVNYSVDPCYDNPLYSATCEGFAAALAALTASATPTDTVENVTNPVPTSSVVQVTPVEEASTAAAPVIDAGGIEVSTTGELSVPDGIPQVVKETDKKKKVTVNRDLLMAIIQRATNQADVMRTVARSIEQSTSEEAMNTKDQEEQVASALTSMSESSSTTTTMDTSTEQQKPQQQVAKKKKPNEAAAGGVSMNDFAATPAGFSAYQTQLADAAFYAPKEIYRGQVNVDNRRAMRGLGSDRLHQEMVRQQYR
jgi:hypothetical protein